MKGRNERKILIIGGASYIARQFMVECKVRGISHLSCRHNLIPHDLSPFEFVVNFSINPRFFLDPYSLEFDQDVKITKYVSQWPDVRYVMISSRSVYPIRDVLEPVPESAELVLSNQTQYGLNKIQSEINCSNVLRPEQMIIVRPSNIFGLESGRHTFMGIAQNSLLTRNEILLDINPKTGRDFMPVTDFCACLLQLIAMEKSGVYNIGTGLAVTLEDICKKLIEGFGSGRLCTTNDAQISDQFALDTSKLFCDTGFSITREQILEYTKRIGCELRNVNA